MSADTPITSPALGSAQNDAGGPDADYASNADLHISDRTPRRDYGTDRQQSDTAVDDAEAGKDLNVATDFAGEETQNDTETQDGADADANNDKDGNIQPVDDATDYNPVENRPRGDQYAPVE